MKNKVEVIEVGPRDGLQNEKKTLSASNKILLIKKLYQTGLRRIEVGSFVSPKKVPQMANSKQVVKKIVQGVFPNARFCALVPNEKGLEDALEAGIREIAFFTSASETFNQKNINCSIRRSFDRLYGITKTLVKNKLKVRAYISVAFYCPYEGKIPYRRVVDVSKKLLDFGCFELSIGDTIGEASCKDVNILLKRILKSVPETKIAMHFHDTKGMAISNVKESLDLGIRKFDSSIGGMGGCPYAFSSAGNLATEDLVYFLNKLGFKTGVDLGNLLKVNRWLSKHFKLPSRVGQSLSGKRTY